METESGIIGGPESTPMGTFTDDMKNMQGRVVAAGAGDRAEEVQDVPTSQGDPAPVVEEPLYVANGVEFKTPKELAAYTHELEKAVIAMKHINTQQPVTQPQPVEQVSSEVPIEDLMFQDTKKAISLLEQRIEKKLETKYQADLTQRDKQKEYWESFYSDNPDLRPLKNVVDSVVRDHWNEVSGLHPDKAKKEIALKTREHISTIVEKTTGRKVELQSRPAVTLGATGAAVSKPAQAAPAKPTSFVDEMKMARKGKQAK